MFYTKVSITVKTDKIIAFFISLIYKIYKTMPFQE